MPGLAHTACRPALLLTAAALAFPALAAAADPDGHARFPDPAKAPPADQYVVQLAAPPVADYRGGAKGFAATAPAPGSGEKVKRGSAPARAWSAELEARQDRALRAAAPGVRPTASYRYAFAGFAARLTPEQAEAMTRQPEVAHVTRERFLRTSQAAAAAGAGGGGSGGGLAGSEAQLMGLTGQDGLWKQLGGPARAGKGIIIGVIDSGITPESGSFKPNGLSAPPSWSGACEAGDRFPVTTCSDKLVGARYFVDGFGAENLPPGAYLSPRDEHGHGTHVASIAAGNRGVDPFVDGNPLGVDTITGAAPAAHVAAYKACWVYGICSNVDVVAAIDAAVADGVDVINLSLGGGHVPEPRIDPIEQALLNADKAGVFVAAAAGNVGTLENAIDSPSTAPWVTSVGATTGTRTFRSTLTLRAGGKTQSLSASATWNGFANVGLFDARSADPDYEGTPFTDPRYCYSGLTRAQVDGKVVLCDAFTPLEILNRVLTPLGVKGILLVGSADDLQDPTIPSLLPAALIEQRQVAGVRAVTEAGGGTATMTATRATATPWPADEMANFSSRGPSSFARDLLRPDVSAPGVNALAAYAPDTYLASIGAESRTPFQVMSGTSMAAPQVAGVGALLSQAHPQWTPAQMRSALVTTARPVTDHGAPANAQAAGAGRIDPTAANDPGLVIAPSGAEYDAYAADAIKARELNMPSVALSDLAGETTVTRTVTSVASTRTTWNVTVEGQRLGAREARVTPARFTVGPGVSQALTVDVYNGQGSPDFGGMTVVMSEVGGTRRVRVPVSVRNPGIVDAPKPIAIDADGRSDGEHEITATVGGTVRPVGLGLAAPVVTPGLRTKPTDGSHEYTQAVTLDRPVQLLAVRATVASAGPRLNVRIVRDVDGDGRFSVVDQNAVVSTAPDGVSFLSDEADAKDLPAGKYLITAFAYDPSGSTEPLEFTLRTWTVEDPRPDDPSPAPGLVVDGDVADLRGRTRHTFTLRWSGVSGDEPLRGVVRWLGDTDANELASSIVALEP